MQSTIITVLSTLAGRRRWPLLALAITVCVSAADLAAATASPPALAPEQLARPPVRIAQLVPGAAIRRHYPGALEGLLRHIAETTTFRVEEDIVVLESFEDPRLFDFPFVYANFADRADWSFSDLERQQLKSYLERGGFLYIDAGINAEFLRENVELGQHHSFPEWDVTPELKDAFAALFPESQFRQLPRAHMLFRVFYEGLPDTSLLPDTVRDYVEAEKWPGGTYSAVGLHVNGRLAVLATPIVAMGWARTQTGNWVTTIRFRVRESTEGLSDYLETAAYTGARFEVVREDGGKDVVYCQRQALPAWVQEPSGRWRVFRYYGSREISDFAHVFYTRLGTNVFVYALTH